MNQQYAERLRVPVSWWIVGTLMVFSTWLAMIVAVPEPLAWGITAVAALVVFGGLARFGSARIAVEDSQLKAGRASIALDFVGEARALDAAETKAVLGVDADARAWLLIRGYLPCAVQVPITDERDPAPYWVLSSRRPQQLAAAINAARPATRL